MSMPLLHASIIVDFSESKQVSCAIYNITFVGVIAYCITLATDQPVNGRVLLQVCCISMMTCTTCDADAMYAPRDPFP
jgi:hypothetical protein